MPKRIADSPSPSVDSPISIAPSEPNANTTTKSSRAQASHKSSLDSKKGHINPKRRFGDGEVGSNVEEDEVKPHISHKSTKRPKMDSPATKGKKGETASDKAVQQNEDDGDNNNDSEDGPRGAPISPSKARLSARAKHAIAEEIVRKGVAALDVADVARQTGLTVTQVRSQICDNRMNLRRQLMQSIQGIQ